MTEEVSKSYGLARRVISENVAAAVWLLFVVVLDCFVLNAFAESARRQECLIGRLRGNLSRGDVRMGAGLRRLAQTGPLC
jgi:hypothetical protein